MREARSGVRFIVFTNDKQKAAGCIQAENAKDVCYISDMGSFSDKEEFC